MKRMLSLLVLPVAVSVAACSSSNLTSPDGPANGLLGTWRLFSMQSTGAPATAVPDGLFTAEFKSDGALQLRADCNVCSARYEAASSAIQVNPLMPCTLAYCASAPLDTQYVQLTAAATAYAVSNDMLELRSAKGALLFRH